MTNARLGWTTWLTILTGCVIAFCIGWQSEISHAHPHSATDAIDNESREVLTRQDESEEQPENEDADQTEDQGVDLSPLVDRLINDQLTTLEEKRALLVFHGQWHRLDPSKLPDELKAQWALMRGDYRNPLLFDEQTPLVYRAQASLARQWDLSNTVELAKALAESSPDMMLQAMFFKAQAHMLMGQQAEALTTLRPLRTILERTNLEDPSELVHAAKGLALLARLEGTPASDHHLAMQLLSKARSVDATYWPAHLAEAQLLNAKGNREEAHQAIMETLSLNPRCTEAWRELGWMYVRVFDFERASLAKRRLFGINNDHPLAWELELRTLIRQRDTDAALSHISTLDAQFPNHRTIQSLLAAVEGVSHQRDAMYARLAKLDESSPGMADPYLITGQVLSAARQYQLAGDLLREAIVREPNWAEAHVQLGLLLMQEGDLPAARKALQQAERLDPFHIRAANQLRLVVELLDEYVTIETEHFIIRCKPGIDEVLARDMAAQMEAMYTEVTETFDHQPTVKTQIDLLPDKHRFAVRITGMPDLWTIAAATGDVIALTPPKTGTSQYGPFNWPEVLRHEFVHTVTLSQTQNRIAHWLTEACAVWQEPAPRSFSRSFMLAQALQDEELFELDEINWGFIRPEQPSDRALAYAQSEWMLEYLLETYGRDAMLELLALHRDGIPNVRAMETVTSKPEAEFMREFKRWATQQVREWGLEEHPDVSIDFTNYEAMQDKQAMREAIYDLAAEYANVPSVQRRIAQWYLEREYDDDAWVHLNIYAELVPVDPWPHFGLVTIARKNNDLGSALDSLIMIEQYEQTHGRWALALAEHFRVQGDFAKALDYATLALNREPYQPRYRELAAAIALQLGDLETALFHLEAMPLLEPEAEIHQRRIDAVKRQLDDNSDRS